METTVERSYSTEEKNRLEDVVGELTRKEQTRSRKRVHHSGTFGVRKVLYGTIL